MAEGRDDGHSNNLSPLEEQYILEADEEEAGVEAQIQREKDLASQKLWCAFQDSATAVAHLFRDCQQQAGLAAWVPFQDSASAVTQLYKGSLDVCRQCVECGVKHGQRKRTRDIVTWLKKKRKVIRREELLAFLLDKPYPPDSFIHYGSEQSEGVTEPYHYPHTHHPSHPTRPALLTSSCINGLNFSPSVPVSVSIPVPASSPCFGGPLPTPRGGRWALLGRDEQSLQNDGELYSVRENSRKRVNSSSTAGNFDFSQESPPLSKRMKI
jgi:hypothetical protein